ncbi:zf-HC2 domain-containing protein [Actinocrinis puniceicyclus]|uniref:Zf-HC2 domain-containing protein n=1 Tax=Actinocrinis puniceicyclus TaxID=977794 RepID=A0A8J7WJQ4_9ACTN|nr:anti-sigma factor [Actinocrinis puniceicyclus]MBS2963553.1 zf-HC2 domain-containing protein [Actinocrinis puniceicyclus]
MSDRARRMREMRECMHVGPKLQAYLDGEVDDATVERVAAHLEYCRKCGLELAAYRAIKHALGQRQQPADDALARLRSFGEQLAATGPEPPADA